MFGSSQAFNSESQATQAPKKAEEKHTCVPVTVRLLLDAVAARADETSEVLIHGSEAGIVVLVGVVEALVQQSAMLEFTLSDASGRMKVRHYGSGSTEELTNGKYVTVTGNLRTSPAVHMSAMSLRAVTSADEVSYHMIEVAHSALRLAAAAKGTQVAVGGLSLGAGLSTPAKLSKGDDLTSPVKVDAPVVAMQIETTSVQTPPPKASLRSSVIKALQVEQSAEGIGLQALFAQLAHCQAPLDKVKDALAELVNEGEVFTTIDDEHFSMI